MSWDRVEDVLGYGGAVAFVAGTVYALWPRLSDAGPLLVTVGAGVLLVAGLEGWANAHARRRAMPGSPEEARRIALARYRAAQGTHELAAKCVAGLAIQNRLKTNPKE